MKTLSKLVASTCVLFLFSFSINAQFYDDFSNTPSGSLNGWTYGTYLGSNEFPGCYQAYQSSYNANTNSLDVYRHFMLPVLDFQANWTFTMEFEFISGGSGNSANFYIIDQSGFGGSQSMPITNSSTSGRKVVTISSSQFASKPNFTGIGRIYISNISSSGTISARIHSVSVTNVSYNPGTGCSIVNQPPNTCADADADGVCDNVDDYPNDPNKAFSSVVPAKTFMYEDLFPAYGDFDFNDLVVSADREIITDADNTLRYLVVEAEVKAAGASIAQGWALELNGINPSDIVSVNGSDVSGNVMTLGANGTENGQTHAVIPVFDNVNKVINWGGGSFFNTVAGDPAGTGETVTVTIEFAKSSNLTVGDLDYNFFSFRTADRSHEIHEMGMAPTSLANQALFGTMADASNLNNGETYVSVDGLPWAISSTGSDYAVEKSDIVEAFLKLAGWAQSGGNSYQDWHTNTAEGTYRNSAKIY